MIKIVDKLDGGWSCETDRDTSKCQGCDKKLSKEFDWCEQDDKFYCDDCIDKHSTRKNHQDWHIIKVIKQGE